MANSRLMDFYGAETRWFLGEVVDVNDPEKIGRVKVKVFGVYDNIETDDLPWAQIVVPITQGVHEGKGQYLGILEGTQVFGMFLDGKDSQLPMVIGTVPKKGDENSKASTTENMYPKNKVYQTETGHFKEYDDSTKGRIKEQHRDGTYYEMDSDSIKIFGDGKVIIQGAKQVEVTAPLVKINS